MGETATGTVERTVDPGGIVDTDILVDALRKVTEAKQFLKPSDHWVAALAFRKHGCENTP